MHLIVRVSAFFLFSMAAFSCSPQAAVTPQDAFYNLKKAFEKSDAVALERQLSQGSIVKIRRITALFSQMNNRQIKSLSVLYGIPEEKFKKLTVREYLNLMLAVERDRNVIGVVTSNRIVGINRDGNRAIVRVGNGMELAFIKEGPYWKFDMTEL